MKTNMRWIIVVLLALLIIFLFSNKKAKHSETVQAVEKNHSAMASTFIEQKGILVQPDKRERPAEVLTTHTPEQWNAFILPKCEGENVTLTQALAIVKDAYRDACQVSAEQALPLEFEGDDKADQKITFHLEHTSLTHTIDYIASQFSKSVLLKDTKFVLANEHKISPPLQANEEEKKITIESKLITSNEKLELPDVNDTDAFVRSLGAKKGVDILNLPSILVRDGEASTIEIMEENTADNDTWKGIVLAYDAERVGLKISIKTKVDQRKEVTKDSKAKYANFMNYTNVAQIKILNEEGEYRYLMQRAKITSPLPENPAPQTTATPPPQNREAKEAIPIAGKSGFVISPYSNQVVDVSGLRPGAIVADPTFPLHEKKFFRVPKEK